MQILEECKLMKVLEERFRDELSVLHDSEKQQGNGLFKIAEAATCHHLKKLLLEHIDQSESLVEKFAQIFTAFGEDATGKSCKFTAALMRSWNRSVVDFKDTSALDAAILAYAIKIEHYQNTSYGCLYEWAVQLGNREVARLLEELLVEEKSVIQALTDQAFLPCYLGVLKVTCISCDRYGHKISGIAELIGNGDCKPF